MSMTEETIRIRPDDIVWQDLDGELVILDLKRSAYLATNATGTLLAKYLTEPRTLAELADHLVAEFGIDRELALADAQAFVTQLREKHLLA
ncbi:PqqD family protein [Nakamurella multipartita]|uniref:Coenzyme PQQ synthesis D n=1 Tax=Nakamurella multipartita (strain ATCC 700099 / DSM 44233 / CIP 104796 / JCM 9543 / NBRC 105858 / Y-104) TaxID=479431 RepID=C8X6N3_NAKMY|nr:PqqD family protein [Nakamurella multipartita]ACV80781.1 hypothetical protein Namu_4500 [Nakamurella multipartita DSM 44233]